MPVPLVAIVGRPNVGKSSLFNWLAGKRISIVDPTAGVTRDRVTTLIEAGGRYFELVDTGGIGIEDSDNLTEEVEGQIKLAIEQAHVVLFVVDVRAGLAPLDEEVGRRLRFVTKPVLLVGNKCDAASLLPQTHDFYKLGRGRLIPVSAEQKLGKTELIEAIIEKLPASLNERPNRDVNLKLAIVGRRNVGKSTFINSLAKSNRMIVSEVAGTTRDSVDVHFERDGKTIVAIDTAGVRKKKSLSSDIEFYSLNRAEKSIRRADVVLMFLDPRLRISQVDKTLTDYILNEHKPAIFVINKWDLVKDEMPTERFGNYVRQIFPMLDYVPIAFITAKSGKNVYTVLNLAQNLRKQTSARVNTGELNQVVHEALELRPPPMRQNRRPKVFYATQVATNPPTVVLFTNGPQLFDPPYQRYLLSTLRDKLPFREVPIKLYLRAKKRESRAETPEPTGEPVKRPEKKTSRKDAPDLSRLKFKSRVSDAEARQAADSDLWRDL
jgi:GTP-binding protein